MYKPLEYDPELKPVDFLKKSAFRAGQIELINKLKAILHKQQEGG